MHDVWLLLASNALNQRLFAIDDRDVVLTIAFNRICGWCIAVFPLLILPIELPPRFAAVYIATEIRRRPASPRCRPSRGSIETVFRGGVGPRYSPSFPVNSRWKICILQFRNTVRGSVGRVLCNRNLSDNSFVLRACRFMFEGGCSPVFSLEPGRFLYVLLVCRACFIV